MSQLSSIIKNHQTVCWYPSAGADLNAINYWNKGLGNKLEPTLFILTDTAYLLNKESLTFYENDKVLYEIPNEFIVSKMKQHIELPNTRDEDKRIKRWKNNYIEANLIKITNYTDLTCKNLKRIIKLGLKDIEDFYPDLDCYIKANYKTLINNENLIKLYETGKADIRLIYQCLDNYSINTSICHHLKKDKVEIILLNTSNEEFYNFCINNSLKIDCLLLQRYFTDGYVFEARSENKVVETLKVKEGIVNPNYSSYAIDTANYASFFWKYYGDERDADKVAFIKYK